MAQQFTESAGAETTFTSGKHKVTMRTIGKNAGTKMADYQSFEPHYEGTVITDLDSLLLLYGKGVSIMYDVFERWGNNMVITKGIVCRSGMKLKFEQGMNFSKYYPKEDIIVFENYDKSVFNLRSGEDEYDPAYVQYAPGGKFRLIYQAYSYLDPAVLWQIYDGKTKTYKTLADLSPFVANRSWRYLIDEDVLYIYYFDNSWDGNSTEIMIETSPNS